jgi:hypothetical protein
MAETITWAPDFTARTASAGDISLSDNISRQFYMTEPNPIVDEYGVRSVPTDDDPEDTGATLTVRGTDPNDG